ncbi:MAG: helix-turn-helix transcriptional regulator [Polyangiaceae bacterium]|nr:helix-turn-helix transcriptional regulator [Myxococcales bacterium]MCB9586114.1 helix-turn-helix transcriptional regulator [Polyangiaceae bacterium]MCB9606792.1 helix-turn-helix transcriptional regulator [Polyangiaceae bacterium]
MSSLVSVVTEVQPDARWVIASQCIPADLVGDVVSWVGYSEQRAAPHRQRELPGGLIHLIFEFGPPLSISDSGGEVCRPRRDQSFVTGLDDSFALTEHAGEQAGVQVSLMPTAARRVLGLPLGALMGLVVDAASLDSFRGGVTRQFASLDTWEERFAWVAGFLRQRLRTLDARRDIAWAVQAIRATRGSVSIQELQRQLGFSRKHLSALFQDQVGVTPKLYAELTRFEGLTEALKAVGTPRQPMPSLAELAQEFGFSDQAHLARNVKRFSGLTPRGLTALLGAPHVELFEGR